MVFFGIDISKLTFDVTVLIENKACHKIFKNTKIGFKVALCAVMRKLLVISFGVLKSEIAFDPNYRKEKAS